MASQSTQGMRHGRSVRIVAYLADTGLGSLAALDVLRFQLSDSEGIGQA